MKPKGITTKLFLAKLKARVKELGGPTLAGDEWGVSPQVLVNAIAGDKLPGPTVLREMGYEFVKDISYRYKEIE